MTIHTAITVDKFHPIFISTNKIKSIQTSHRLRKSNYIRSIPIAYLLFNGINNGVSNPIVNEQPSKLILSVRQFPVQDKHQNSVVSALIRAVIYPALFTLIPDGKGISFSFCSILCIFPALQHISSLIASSNGVYLSLVLFIVWCKFWMCGISSVCVVYA